MQILGISYENHLKRLADCFKSTKIFVYVAEIENTLVELSGYLKYVKTERGGAVMSSDLSRLVQRRIVLILSLQLYTAEGRANAIK
jgi:hypothetical protein